SGRRLYLYLERRRDSRPHPPSRRQAAPVEVDRKTETIFFHSTVRHSCWIILAFAGHPNSDHHWATFRKRKGSSFLRRMHMRFVYCLAAVLLALAFTPRAQSD